MMTKLSIVATVDCRYRRPSLLAIVFVVISYKSVFVVLLELAPLLSSERQSSTAMVRMVRRWADAENAG
ncbi:hypothetical protein [Halomonas sp. DN3]|uniref:hypothetical protein n=1 Tax=Halomonas sp. DN3 TaxID=2953657 RepID=UPI0020A13FCD|nr:hypothetical protein [Halomonas sp. DN3]USZ48966.1 hypothetical protein NKF27_15880 [Halomonas sp. DN3]